MAQRQIPSLVKQLSVCATSITASAASLAGCSASPASAAAAAVAARCGGVCSTSAPSISNAFLLFSKGCWQTRLISNAVSTAPHRRGVPAGPGKGFLHGLLRDYKQLSKLKLSALVTLTATSGFVAGSGEVIDWAGAVLTSLGTFGAAACANTLNQLYEVTNDARMTRTAGRPLPAGRIGRLHAAVFAAVTGMAGVSLLYTQVNPLTAGLGAANIVLYAAMYTPLKQISVANTWVGALVGAIPPLMGWAGAAGQLEPGAAILAAILFAWQMPHFLSLAWFCKDDYIRGGFRMLSSVDPMGRRTGGVALRYSLLLVGLGGATVALGMATPAFGWESAALGGIMAAGSLRFLISPSVPFSRVLFKTSLLYLPLLLAGLAVHRRPNDHTLDGHAVLQAFVDFGVKLMLAVHDMLLAVVPGMEGGLEAMARQVASGNEGLPSSVACPSKAYGDSGELVEMESEGEDEGGVEALNTAGPVDMADAKA